MIPPAGNIADPPVRVTPRLFRVYPGALTAIDDRTRPGMLLLLLRLAAVIVVPPVGVMLAWKTKSSPGRGAPGVPPWVTQLPALFQRLSTAPVQNRWTGTIRSPQRLQPGAGRPEFRPPGLRAVAHDTTPREIP